MPHEYTCDFCGKAFTRPQSNVRGNHVYCSQSCAKRGRPRPSLAERLSAAIPSGGPDECWEWQASRNQHGYGTMRYRQRSTLAHRMVWESIFGPIPESMNVLHRCDNRACCNPRHLFLGDQPANIKDMIDKGRDRHPSGEDHGRAKLTNGDVLVILSTPELTGPQLAERFGVSRSTISRIRRQGGWLKAAH